MNRGVVKLDAYTYVAKYQALRLRERPVRAAHSESPPSSRTTPRERRPLKTPTIAITPAALSLGPAYTPAYRAGEGRGAILPTACEAEGNSGEQV